MRKQKRPDVETLVDFIRVESDRILGKCSQCARCYDVCPMTPYAGIDLRPEMGPQVVGSILDVLRLGDGSPEALAWARVCTGSGECVPMCPEGVNPLLMLRLARMVASGGTGGKVQIPMVDDLKHFPRMRAYAQMQLTDEEIEKWL